MTKRIFVSATFEDLKDHRKAIRNVIRRMGFEDVAMEYYTAEDKRPLDKCLADVRRSDCYVGLFAFRYGFIPEGCDRSITELEYRAAREAGLECLVFMIKEDHPWNQTHSDSHVGNREQISRLRAELSSCLVAGVTTPDDCAGKVASALYNWSERIRPSADSAPAHDARSRYLAHLLVSDGPVADSFVDLDCREFGRPPGIPEDWPANLIPPSYVQIQGILETEGLADDPIPAQPPESLRRFSEVLKLHRRFLLSGPAGAGKTTSLKYARWWAATVARRDANAPLPLWVDLANWPEAAPDFRSFLSLSREAEGAPPLAPEQFLLLVDGLNELDSDLHESRLSSIRQWLAMNPARPIMVSVRHSFNRAYRSLNLPLIELQPLTPGQVGAFADNYLGQDGSASLLERVGLVRQAGGSARLAKVVSNPFYLGVLCYLFRSLPGSVPTSPALVSRLFVKVLYEKSFKARERGITYDRFVGDLGFLAVGAIEGGAGSPFTSDWALKHLGAGRESIVDLAVDCGILGLQEESKRLRFGHQIIQDYLAAEFFLGDEVELSRLASSPVFRNGDRIPGRWDEVFITLVQLDGAIAIMRYMADIDPVLVSDALHTAPAFGANHEDLAELKLKTVAGLVRILRGIDGEARIATKKRLIASGEEAVRPLLSLFEVGNHFVRRNVVATLQGIGGPEALKGVLLALLDANRWVRRTAREAIIDASDPSLEVLETLVGEVIATFELEDRESLVGELSLCWPAERETVLRTICADHGLELGDEMEAGQPVEDPEEPFAGESESDLNTWGLELPRRLSHDEVRPATIERGKRWLETVPVHLPSWSFVWCALVEVVGAEDERLLDLAKKWLREAPVEHSGWSYVFVMLWERCRDEDLRRTVLGWLERAEGLHPGWPYVWHLLFHDELSTDHLERLAKRWLAHNDDWTPGREYVLGDLLRAGSFTAREMAKSAGLRFLAFRDPETPAWSYVWRALRRIEPQNHELLGSGVRWLEEIDPSHPGWGYVWPALWESLPGDPDLQGMGRKWLAGAPVEHRSWTYVWVPLWDTGEDDDLRSWAMKWLAVASRKGRGWSMVWTRLWRTSVEREHLVRLAWAWLRSVEPGEEEKGWSIVWDHLWSDRSDPNLRRLLEERLPTVGAGGGSVLKCGLESLGREDGHLAQITSWLSRYPSAADWLDLWKSVAQTVQVDDALVGASQKWFHHNGSGAARWDLVCGWLRSIGRFSPELETVLDRVEAVLGARTAEGDEWARQWQKLWESGRRTDAVFDLAAGWVEDPRNFGYVSWPFVWGKLWNGPIRQRSQVADIGRSWLDAVVPERPAWALVWGSLVDSGEISNSQRRLGLQWLDASYYPRSSWRNMWHRLWDLFPDERGNLLEHARGWRDSQRRRDPIIEERLSDLEGLSEDPRPA